VSAPRPVAFNDVRAGWDEVAADARAAFDRVLASGAYVLGPEVAAFEAELAAQAGVAHAVGVGNGFDALALVLRAWGVGPGDEVVVPAMTAVPTWMAPASLGATCVPVDVREATGGLDPDRLEQALTPRTRAIVLVHLYGIPAEVGAIAAIAAARGIPVLEDAAQAQGARLGGRPVGGLTQAAALSFYPTKNLGALGDGGAVLTSDDALAEQVRLLRMYGWRRANDPDEVGVNSRLDELQAALLRVRLERMAAWGTRRAEIAGRYLAELDGVPGLELPEVPDGAEPYWHLFTVRTDARDALAQALADRGIGTAVHYRVCPADARPFRTDPPADVPAARRIAARTLSLPLYPQLGDDAVSAVVAAVRTSSS
jgi:dTDP-3-amino-3,4,6-trideoxy-alpha-D-glucose transaminase